MKEGGAMEIGEGGEGRGVSTSGGGDGAPRGIYYQ